MKTPEHPTGNSELSSKDAEPAAQPGGLVDQPAGTASADSPPPSEADEYAKWRNELLLRPSQNRIRIFEALPEVAEYYGTGLLDPPEKLQEEAEPKLHQLLGQVARHHLGESQWARLRHPRSGYQSQVVDDEGRLMITQVEATEETHDGDRFRKRVRFVERPDGVFWHDDVTIKVESEPEYASSSVHSRHATGRMEMISVLFLLLESDEEYREE